MKVHLSCNLDISLKTDPQKAKLLWGVRERSMLGHRSTMHIHVLTHMDINTGTHFVIFLMWHVMILNCMYKLMQCLLRHVKWNKMKSSSLCFCKKIYCYIIYAGKIAHNIYEWNLQTEKLSWENYIFQVTNYSILY